MLISHLKHFIFLKTKKTAGTSVEVFLEQFCQTDYAGPAHHRAESVTEAGVIGSRGPGHDSSTFFNHAPARLIRDAIGDDVWTAYHKITCIRDPFDKAVSGFWMWKAESLREAPFGVVKDAFRAYVLDGGPPTDRAVYTLDDVPCCDTYIRFEHLVADVAAVSTLLALPFDPGQLGRYKSNRRPADWPLAAYYDPDTVDRVLKVYGPEFEWFGYASRPSGPSSG